MKAAEFHALGQALRKAVDPMLPEDMRSAPAQPQAPTMDTPPVPGNSPTRGQDTGLDFDYQLGSNTYDRRVTDSIINQFIDAGYDPRFAVGMAANAMVESSNDPTAYNEEEGSFGLFQHRLDRLDNLRSFADRMGKSVNDINAQISFAIHEMGAAERVAYSRITGRDPQSAGEYAALIDKYYERSDGKARNRRAALAEEIYADYFGEGGRAGRQAFTYGQDIQPLQTQAQDRTAFMIGLGNGGELDMGNNPATRNQSIPQSVLSARSSVGAGSAGQRASIPSSVGAGDQSPSSGFMDRLLNSSAGEGDQETTDRRRGLFLAAAEGFQMLSRGTTANFTGVAQQRLDERQRRTDNDFRVTEQQRQQFNQDRQAARLERAQQLEERKFVFAQQQYGLSQAQGAQRKENIARIAEDAGLSVAADLARAGQLDAATGLITAAQEAATAPKSFMSTATTSAAVERAEAMGRPDLVASLQDPNPDVSEEAFKQVVRAETEGGDNTAAEQMLINAIPPNATPSQRQQLEATAKVAASDPDLYDDYMKRVNDVASAPSPYAESVNKIFESDQEEYARNTAPASGLRSAANAATTIAVNPEFDSGALREGFITPLARLVRDLPGGEAFAEDILATDSMDIAGSKILQALRNGQLGNLGQGVNGQLSNLEGDRLLSRLADGSASRVEILALSQIMRRTLAQQEAVSRARLMYQKEMGNDLNNFSIDEYTDVKQQAADQVELFERMSDAERDQRALDYLDAYGVTDPRKLPPEIVGEVVSVLGPNGSIELVPVFSEMFPELRTVIGPQL